MCYPSKTILKMDEQQPILKEFFKKFLVCSTKTPALKTASIEFNKNNLTANVKLSGSTIEFQVFFITN